MTVLNTASRVYLGGARADAIYLGAVKVFPPAPTDLSSSMVAGAGTWGVGSLDIPAWDATYTVTSTASVPSTDTPGVGVRFPVPSTPSVAHTITATYAVTGRTRRFFHDLFSHDYYSMQATYARFEHVDGLLVEASSTIGSTATLVYAWDPSSQTVTVSSYSGDVTTRQHGPVDTSETVPLTFTPELRADALFTDVKAAVLTGVGAVPSTLRTILAAEQVVVDVNFDGGATGVSQSLYLRSFMNPSTGTATNGFTVLDTVTARALWVASGGNPSPNGWEARTVLHELGHAVDYYWLSGTDSPQGVDGVAPLSSYTYYWPDGVTPQTTLYTHPWFGVSGIYPRIILYDESGTVTNDDTYSDPMPTGYKGKLTAEPDLIAIHAEIASAPSVDPYYRDNIREWFAQSFMLHFITDVPGYVDSGGQFTSLVTEVGGSTNLAAFVTYMQGIGVFPT